ncbi:MAG: ATP-binding protein [Potamolinea sp.]
MDQVQRSRDLINSVLHYSQMGSNQGEKIEVNLNSLVTEVVEMLCYQNIDIEIAKELPTLACQPVQMPQIFLNLISNAVKYMDKPQGNIKIGCTAEQDYWKFSVADNGPGIESKYFDHIFQLFKTLPSNNQVDSTGVGLATVKKIVELYGGKIWVESRVGDGSTFFFTLPTAGY